MSAEFGLNLNRAHPDKYSLVLPNIPSSELLSEEETQEGVFKDLITDQNYFNLSLQAVELPGLTVGELKVPTMHSPIAHVDMVYNYDPITTELRVDKNFLVYKLMILWMHLIKHPEQFNQFDATETFKRTTTTGTILMRENVRDDMGKEFEPVISFDFFDFRPISVSSIPLNYANSGEDITLTVTWLYSYFMPRKHNGDPYNIRLEV
jgi:hypothetical protein